MQFFSDVELTARKGAALRAPPIPETGWRPPQYYPDLTRALVIGFDVEGYDPELTTHGPGWARGPIGNLVGISVAWIMPDFSRGKLYFPFAHTVERDWNLDQGHTIAWAKAMLETPHIPKVGANLIYDIGWLVEYGIQVQGKLHDIQVAEALLNETGEVNLDWLATKYCGAGKTTSLLYEWCSQAYGGPVSGKQRKNIYRAPPRLVGPYAEDDADLPLQVWEHQLPLLQQEGLINLFDMECDLIPLLVKMRYEGAQTDVNQVEFVYDKIGDKLKEFNAELKAKVGFECNVDANEHLARAFDSAGLKYNRTAPSRNHPHGQPSFTKDFLKNLQHPLADIINGVRECQKLQGTFLQGYLLDGSINGKIHCSFNSLRGDDDNADGSGVGGGSKGTRTGRFSSSDPNLQNIPVRSDLGALIRTCFIADIGHYQWRKFDYSQIEYRFHVHYAIGPGSNEVRQRFCNDPSTDYHVLTQLLVQEKTGKLIERKPIKNINFGLLYGMGQAKLARQLGLNPNDAKELFKAYHAGNPYTLATMQAVAEEAQRLGYVTTILGRRRRFDLWEPMETDWDNRAFALPRPQALAQWGSAIKRAGTHKGVNSRYQGSSADQMKAGMLACWKSGVFDHTGVPRLTVHDELDFSQRDDSSLTREAFQFIQYTMETIIPLRIPVKVDCSWGKNWGEAK